MHDTNLLEDQPIAWTPTPDVIERAQLTRFMRQVGVTTWDELYEFSIRDVERFTEEVLKFLDIKFDPPYSQLLDTSDGVELPRWFSANAKSDVDTRRHRSEPRAVATGSPRDEAQSDSSELPPRQPKRLTPLLNKEGSLNDPHSSLVAGLNITTMCLDRWQTDEMKDQPAVIWEGEEGGSRILSYSNLLSSVKSCAGKLERNGIGRGDAIGIHMPMLPETVVALLAINRIGAIAVPVFSGYGVDAIASRLNAVKAKALFTSDHFPRRSKSFDALSVAADAVRGVGTIECVFINEREVGRKAGDPEFRWIDCATGIIQESTERLEHYEKELFPKQHVERWFADPSQDIFAFAAGSTEKVEPTSAEDPLIILYTSGTTGKPKGIAHTHASFPIKAAQDMAFGTDVGRGTRISWYTDIGWMMGPWLIYGALINGATICIYDGAPDYPTPDRMWEFCAKHKVEVLGISPTLVRALAAHEGTSQINATNHPADEASAPLLFQGAESEENSPPYKGGVAAASADGVVLSSLTNSNSTQPAGENHPAEAAPLLRKEGSSEAPYQRHDLSSLRMFASTGEPWNPAPWWWLFEKVGNSKLPIINYSGGTEIAGGILMGNPLLPIKPCSFPAPCPGMDVDILDEEGKPVGPNQVGELVIKQPWIGMARGFWQEKERYLDTYWRRFKNIWVHGDWAMRDKDGHWFILGRSDDTLKVAGKRVGPAEVESLLIAHPLVTEAAVIGVPDEAKGTAMVAFCVLQNSPPYKGGVAAASADGVVLSGATTRHGERTEQLEAELKSLVARDMGRPLAPSKIHFVSALPKTRNAKVMRRVIRAAYLGEDPGDLSALENPKTVDAIKAVRSTAP